MIVPIAEVEPAETLNELRWRAGHYQRLHADAVEREGILKSRVDALNELIERQQAQITEQAQEIENLKADNAWLKQQLFGQKSEQTSLDCQGNPLTGTASATVPQEGKKKRGQQPGSQGHGRQSRTHPRLKVEEIEHELPEDQRACPRCKLPFI